MNIELYSFSLLQSLTTILISIFKNESTYNNEGWQSQRNCTYPQILIIQPLQEDDIGSVNHNDDYDDEESNSKHGGRKRNNEKNMPKCTEITRPTSSFYLTKMKILGHNCKIPQKIEIYTSLSSTTNDNNDHINTSDSSETESTHRDETVNNWINDEKLSFKRMGYVTFDNNTKTKYRARELKSITMNVEVTYIKLVIHPCHGYKKEGYNHDRLMHDDENDGDGDEEDGSFDDVEENESMNPYNQVGIVNIGLFQKKKGRRSSSNHINSSSTKLENNQSKFIEEEDLVEKKGIESISKNTSTKLSTPKRITSPKFEQCEGNTCKVKVKPMNPRDIIDFQSRVAKMEQIMRVVAEKEVRFEYCFSHASILITRITNYTSFRTLKLQLS